MKGSTHFLFNVACTMQIDATAVHFLDAFLDELKREGLQLALANPSQQVGCRFIGVLLTRQGGCAGQPVTAGAAQLFGNAAAL